MIITRRIEIYVHEEDRELKQQFMKTIYGWRDAVRQAANLIVTHKFVQQNVRDFMYLQEDVRERFKVVNPKNGKETVKYNISDTLEKGPGLSEQNTTYRLIASILKGKVPADIYSSLNQSVSSTVKESLLKVSRGEMTLRSYKNNIPIPFSGKALANIHKNEDDKRYYFTLFGIPFACRLGMDRSNNGVIIDRCIGGEYKICSSSIAFQKTINRETGKAKQKLFLYLCADIPQQEVELAPEKHMFCYLGINHPIQYNYEVQAKNIFDGGVKWGYIGDVEEFTYRRTQIQEAIRRCQKNCRYNRGGKGRKAKLQALARYEKIEKNYVHTKLHTYSQMLVDLAVKNRCGIVVLVGQKQKEEQAKDAAKKGQPFLLRNWSYFGLKTLIEYKAKKYDIKVISVGKEDTDDEETISTEE